MQYRHQAHTNSIMQHMHRIMIRKVMLARCPACAHILANIMVHRSAHAQAAAWYTCTDISMLMQADFLSRHEQPAATATRITRRTPAAAAPAAAANSHALPPAATSSSQDAGMPAAGDVDDGE